MFGSPQSEEGSRFLHGIPDGLVVHQGEGISGQLPFGVQVLTHGGGKHCEADILRGICGGFVGPSKDPSAFPVNVVGAGTEGLLVGKIYQG